MTEDKAKGRFIWTEKDKPIVTHSKEEFLKVAAEARKALQNIYKKAEEAEKKTPKV